jgi:hypothetical protein
VDLLIDAERWKEKEYWNLVETGIYVRAKSPEGKWESVDINLLDATSLLHWLRSGGEKNELAENVVGILLGHGHIT